MVGSVSLPELVVETAIRRPRSRARPSLALAGAEVELAGARWPASVGSRRRSTEIAADRDYVLIDCPPSLGLLTVNALTAADAVLIPIQCEYYALEGLTQLIATINLVRDHLNPGLAIKGVVLTMFDARTNLSTEVAAEVRRHLGRRVYETVIPRSVRLSEAPSYGLPDRPVPPRLEGRARHTARSRIEFLRRSDGRARRHRRIGFAVAPRPGRRRPGGRAVTARPGERPTALGRGPRLAHPRTSRRRSRRRPRSRSTGSSANPYQPRRAFDDAELEAARRQHRQHGVLQPVLVTETLDGYQLVAGRAAAPRGAAGRPRAHPGGRPPARRPAPARARARREPPARGPQPARGGARLPPAHRRVRLHPGAARRDGRAGPFHGREHASPARAAASRPGRVGRRADHRRPRSRDGRPRRGRRRRRPRDRRRPRHLGPPDRGARAPDARADAPDRRSARRAPSTRISSASRRTCVAALGTKVSLARSRRGGRIVIEYYSDEELGRLYDRLIGGPA